ncbi:ABC transporter permease [Herpetosiphon llansteffanensis]|uniref:ABC transporter permease n=1 Tax=Herpetosiphon llansteffanensis TaxID=2094568 RepID=UPI000D7CFB0A|nr:ABC transporter permease [Herpetosiphon llansteffanensis]
MLSLTGALTSAWQRLTHGSANIAKAKQDDEQRAKQQLSRIGRVAAGMLLLMVVAVSIGPLFWQVDPLAQHIGQRLNPPSLSNPLGTDQFGRDVLARILIGGRWSLAGAALVCLGTSCLGLAIGACCALGPRWLDYLLSRMTETLQAIPAVLLALALSAILSRSFGNLLLALVLTNWTWYARMYRALIMKELAMPYIEGAQVIGVKPLAILTRHVLPNLFGALVVVATTNFGSVILNLSALSFIGFGLNPPTPEWGNLINESRTFFQREPRLMIIPGLCIATTVLWINLLGNALRDRVDLDKT